ncbi:MAG TPA: hypothetical protein ENI34_04690 [candidate division WOR-3 bacterium]|uniref:WD40 repeat domain-containing protein n=1 Tax=candidate division WOR-3 bacterium TaxID=2052148 RepID=A0A9C9EM01_UNCW3|nr:hypothetical protein [candidate division WOR-3 bacterium]
MRGLILIAVIALMTVAGLYAQEKDITQEEQKISLELIWAKEIPEWVKDFVFLDEDGYNVFSVQCKDSEKALKNKRILMIQEGKLRVYEGDEMKMTNEISLRGGHITISKNGRNIATIDGLERDPSGKGGYTAKPATLRLYNWKGEELAQTQFSPPAGLEYILLYPLGDDQAVAVGLSGNEGLYHGLKIFVRRGKILREAFSNDETSWVVDYAENGDRVLVALENKYMVLFNGAGKEVCRYICPRAYRKGFLSPKGNYIAEITAGKYVMIFDRQGRLIAEHHVQGQGNYYAAFSPDEKCLCVTPGPWRVYFFETKTGKLLWEYVDTLSRFRSIAVAPVSNNTFLSSTLYHPTNYSLQEMADKVLVVINHIGEVMRKDIVSSVKTAEELEFYRWKSVAPPLRITPDGRFLLVRLPNRLLLYLVKNGGER